MVSKSSVSRSDLSSFIYVFVLVWSGRELGWGVYVIFFYVVFMCLAWYGSQTEAGGVRCL